MAGLGTLATVGSPGEMVSDAVRSLPGAVLLAVSCCCLAAAGASLCLGVRAALSRTRLLTALLVAWCVALVVVALFPANPPGAPLDHAAMVHRYGAAPVAALPPLFELLVAEVAAPRRGAMLPGPAPVRLLRGASLAALGACLAFGALNGQAVLAGDDLLPHSGVAERILLALVLVVVGLSVRVVGHEPASGRRTPHERATLY
ncbi:DUF998 domain-containing protein [Actinoplanes sp. RD1]|uniref:DUF998 domain-containing protein n=1 Tax=Actinoplanes sp. RD1 TaxID=3064538 RepID=UPI0027424AF2|nr:DUF998 domain-containing protein [Actinoplanes sp. RD1]